MARYRNGGGRKEIRDRNWIGSFFFYFRVPLSFPAEIDKKMNSDNDIWDLRLRYFEWLYLVGCSISRKPRSSVSNSARFSSYIFFSSFNFHEHSNRRDLKQ